MPLFYAWHNETLYLASEVKALFASGVPAVWLPNYISTMLGDRMEMAHSIEGRVPFLARHDTWRNPDLDGSGERLRSPAAIPDERGQVIA